MIKLPDAAPISAAKTDKKNSVLKRLLLMIFLGIAGGGGLVWFYWEYKVKPRLEGLGVVEPETKKQKETIRAEENPTADFDLNLHLLGEPLGMAANRRNLIIGNRKDPWGFLRVVPLGDNEFEISQIPIFEPQYNQKISFSTVAWNGSDYVAYADGAWFQSPNKSVFTIHDPRSLKMIRHHPATELLGGLAWDGQYYWAATRKNTADSNEPAYLYKLDSTFSEIARYEPPSVGCQGLAWDGYKLWSVDVFTDNIYLIDIQQDPPRTVHTYRTHFNYLSGIAYDGSHIWVTEYDHNQAHRLNRSLRLAWLKDDLQVASADQATNFIEEHQNLSEEKESNQFESTKLTDSYSRFTQDELSAEDAEVISFSISLKENELYGSWNIFFGENLFSGDSSSGEGEMGFPVFAKYYINVEGGNLEQPLRLEFEAEPGSNIRENELLTSDLDPGECKANIFIHVQYVNQEGTNRVLNNSSSSLSVRN
ncbi:MAG TPA: hypothetical protein VLH08_15965 [Acidobacteriota bacterium]|nr:hypothetical protein [Acidobacteriota bacterium]